MPPRSRAERLHRYQRAVEVPLAVGAVAFLAVYATTVLWRGMPPAVRTTGNALDVLLWAGFVADLVARTALHPRRGRFLLTHPLDVAIAVLPALGPLRVLRVFTAVQALLTRGGVLRRGQAILTAAALLVFVGALAELDAERDAHGATITTFGDALWWAMSTVTTVGYGDVYPVTGTGRLVAVGLMVVGISVVGTITATVAAWFVAQRQQEDERQARRVRQLSAEIRALRAELSRRPGPAAAAGPGAAGASAAPAQGEGDGSA